MSKVANMENGLYLTNEQVKKLAKGKTIVLKRPRFHAHPFTIVPLILSKKELKLRKLETLLAKTESKVEAIKKKLRKGVVRTTETATP